MKKEMQLYIHIPFCAKKCDYCDFLSFAAGKETQKEYVEALIRELNYYGERYQERVISTIFIGGGTPSFIEAELLEAVMKAVYQAFHVLPDAEISMECNPGTVTKEKLLAYKKAGVNRLSIGLQSPNDEELKILGRIHTFETFLQTYDMARNCGFTNINVDLMSSLPGQTKQSFLNGLKKVVRLKPEHISAYSLIIEEGTPFYDKYEEDMERQAKGEETRFLPREEEVYETIRLTREYLQEEGYHWYEISNFAKPGKECRHNIGYWKRADYLGVGLGAASLIDNVRYANTSDLQLYVKKWQGQEPQEICIVEEEILTKMAQIEEFMFLGLRMTEGVKRSDFKACFGIEPEGAYANVLSSLQDEGLLKMEAGWIALTDKGIDVSNYVLAQFLLA